jgi:hypothetical protein
MSRILADDVLVHRIVAAAGAAPSFHNSQPWRFRVTGPDLIEMHAEIDRMLWVADPRARALHLSCGAALFNMRLAIRSSGYRAMVWPLPHPDDEPTLIASVQVADGRPATASERDMFDAIGLRHSSRMPYSDRPVPEAVQVSLEQEAASEGTVLRILSARDAGIVLSMVQAADRELRADRQHESELAGWVGAPARTGYGIPWQALGPRPDREPAPVRDFSRHPAAECPPATFELQPKLAVLATARDRSEDWLRAGQGMQRVLLTATRHGLSTSLLYQPIELHDMHDQPGWWPWPEQPQIIVRFGYGPPVSATPRLPLTEVLDDDDGAGGS